MRASGKYPDHNVFPFVLKPCTHLMDLRFGESVHGYIIRLGMDFDLYTAGVLDKSPNAGKTDKYSSSFVDFDKLIGNDMHNESSCSNSYELIDEFEKQVDSGDHIGCSKQMSYMLPQNNTQRWVFDESHGKSDTTKGEKGALHAYSVRNFFEMMSIKDLVSWTIMIAGNAQNAMYEEALERWGKEIYGYAIRHGFDTDVYIGSSLIDMPEIVPSNVVGKG
ncbi:hypothetical protein CsSME_00033765 [Camellia sinensis var. sinensis]